MPARILVASLAALLFVALPLVGCGKRVRPGLGPTGTPVGVSTPQPQPPQGRVVYYVAPGGSDSNPGTLDQPWATLHHAAEVLSAGETVYVRGGTYPITEQIRLKNSGTEDAWIVYAGYPGEQAVIDAHEIEDFAPAREPPYPRDQGAFQIEGVSYVRVENLKIVNSHSAAFTVRDSHHVELLHNATDNTFSSGIAVWDTDHDGQGTDHIKVIGNTVVHANTWDMIPAGVARSGEPPHEAISIAGAYYFEVAYNHVYDCDKEGIDVKETSHHGTVHHNHVHHVDRQGLYVDSWFGKLEDVEIYENVVHDCRGAGLILSVENGELVNDVHIHHNLIFDNWGSGIFFSRWGDGPRTNVQIYNNTIHHNGYGTPSPGNEYFWLTGGLYLYSTNLRNVDIRNNIFSDNRGFQVGYSDHYLRINPDVEAVLREKGIAIAYNLIFDRNDVAYPIYVGWPPRDYANVYAISGDHALEGDPLFVDPQAQDFRLRSGSPACGQAPHASGGSGDGLPTPSCGQAPHASGGSGDGLPTPSCGQAPHASGGSGDGLPTPSCGQAPHASGGCRDGLPTPSCGQAPHASGGCRDGLPTPSIGAYPAGAEPDFWWKANFPPHMGGEE